MSNYKKSNISPVHIIAISPDNNYLVSGSEDCNIRVWNLETGTLIHTLKGHWRSIIDISISSDNKYIVTASEDCHSCVWDIQTGESLYTIGSAGESDMWFYSLTKVGFLNIKISKNLKYMAMTGDQYSINIYSIEDSRNELFILPGHSSIIYNFSFSNDNKHLVSHDNKTLKLWDLEKKSLIFEKSGDFSSGRLYNEDNSFIIIIDDILNEDNSVIKLLDPDTGSTIYEIKADDYGITSVSISKSRKYLVSSSENRTIRIWDMQKSKILHVIKGDEWALNSNIITNDDKFVFLSSETGAIRMINVETGEETGKLIAFSDGGWYIEDKEGRWSSSDPLKNGYILHYRNSIRIHSSISEYYKSGLFTENLVTRPLPKVDPFDFSISTKIMLSKSELKTYIFKVSISDSDGKIGQVHLIINDIIFNVKVINFIDNEAIFKLNILNYLKLFRTFLFRNREYLVSMQVKNIQDHNKPKLVTYSVPILFKFPDLLSEIIDRVKNIFCIVAGIKD